MSLLPFQILPTEQLRPESRVKPSPNIVKSLHSEDDIIEIQPSVQNRVKKDQPLDEESGKAILNFIYNRPNNPNNNNNKDVSSNLTPNTSKPRNNQKGLVFTYVDDRVNEKNQNKSILSLLAEKTKVITMENIKKIDKKFLLINNVTIRNLIEDCQVSPVNLYMAGILTTFEDLIHLDFQLTDLTIGDRKLFNADKLLTFFGADYKYMREHKKFSFSLAEMKEVDFYPTELSALGFDFSELVDEKMIKRQDLRDLNFTFDGFKLLGLTKAHAIPLNISRNFALTKLKWTADQCDDFDLNDIKLRNKKQIK